MKLSKCVAVLGDIQQVLAAIERLPSALRSPVTQAAAGIGVSISSLHQRVVKAKQCLQEAPEGSFLPVFVVSSSHLSPDVRGALQDPTSRLAATIRSAGVRVERWGERISLDFSGCPDEWTHVRGELFSMPQLAYWARLVGASCIVLDEHGPVVEGLPLFDATVAIV